MRANEILGAVILVVVTAVATKQYVIWQLRQKLRNGLKAQDKFSGHQNIEY